LRRAALSARLADLPSPWIIVVTWPTAEFTCEKILDQLKIEHYCPARIVEARGGVRRTVRPQLLPAFPRYLFLRLPAGQFIRLEQVTTIAGILRVDGLPLWVKLPVLRDVIRRELAGEFDRLRLAAWPGQGG
jgi:hypothetical protein